MKQGNWRKKLEYFWMYYKIPFLAVLGVCVVIVYFGYAKITEKEYAFNAILLDIHTNAQEEMLEEEFADYAGIDTKKYDVLISTSLLFSDSSSGNYAMTSLARLYTQIGTEELDVTVGRLVCLESLEHLLRVVEHHSGRVEREILIGDDSRVVPALAFGVVHNEHMVGKVVAEAELVLIGLLLRRSGFFNFNINHVVIPPLKYH